MYKFYHTLLARRNHLKQFQKRFLNILYKFQKTEYDEVRSSLLSNIIVVLLVLLQL